MQSNRSLPRPAPTGPAPAFAADASRRLLPTSVREGDRLLRLLAAVRSVLVVHLARAAAAVVAHEVWHLCCYRTRTDFARERLRRDGRWLRDMIRLHEALERLPRLLPALCGDDGGRPLGQVAVLQIARVATPEDVEAWIERARRLSLDELRTAVATHLRDQEASPSRAGDPPSAVVRALHSVADPVPYPTAGPAPHDDEDDEPLVTLRQRLPPDVKWAFDAARDLHRHLEGSEVSLSRFVQDLVGEVASSGCLPPDDFTPRLPAPARANQNGDDTGPGPRPANTPGNTDPGDRSAVVLALHTPAMRRALQRLATFDRLRCSLARLDQKLQLRPNKKSRTYRRDTRRIARIL
jgi:hypothetical protein